MLSAPACRLLVRRASHRRAGDARRHPPDLRAGNPWLFDGSITSGEPRRRVPAISPSCSTTSRNFVAVGLWDPASPIRVKILHNGEPRDDRRGVVARADGGCARAAVDARRRRHHTAYRCVHGENDGCQGSSSIATTDARRQALHRGLVPPPRRRSSTRWSRSLEPERIVLRLSRAVADADTFGLSEGDDRRRRRPTGPSCSASAGSRWRPTSCTARRPGTSSTNVTTGRWCGGARPLRVLDVFASTGGFAVNAAAGGATVGAHGRPLGAGDAHRRAQHRPQPVHRTVRGCAVHTVAAMPSRCSTGSVAAERDADRFDVVVLDPPSFAQSQANVASALRAYAKLTRLGVGAASRPAVCSCRRRARAASPPTSSTRPCSSGRAEPAVELDEIRRTGHPSTTRSGFRRAPTSRRCSPRVEPGRRWTRRATWTERPPYDRFDAEDDTLQRRRVEGQGR